MSNAAEHLLWPVRVPIREIRKRLIGRVEKRRVRYSHLRIRKLVERFEGRIRRRFRDIVRQMLGSMPMTKLERLIAEGRADEALRVVERAAFILSAESTKAYVVSGGDVASWLEDVIRIPFHFDVANPSAVQWSQQNQLRLVREFSAAQRVATREAITEGILRGANPREQARAFRDSIGLTQRQVKAVGNFRRLLEERSAESLTRKLRDRRFDPTVRANIRGDRVLTRPEINKMVSRYRERYIKYRSEVIARTESLTAVHAGNEEMFSQAIESGDLNADQLTREWNTAGNDGRVRDPAHTRMHRQIRDFGVPFTSGIGNSLRYPGDPSAPAADRVQCRCAVGTRLAL